MTRFDYIKLGRQVYIFTDHSNLLSIYDPFGSPLDLPRSEMKNLMRWAVNLSAYGYVIEHIPGELIVCADLFGK